MARDWEAWLGTASGPASPTEDDERDRTLDQVRNAIQRADDIPSSVRVYAKGSYANNTNVKRDADVDIAVEWNNTIKVFTWGDTAGMTPEQLGYTPAHESMTPHAFRGLVEKALIDGVGADRVNSSPNKCIGVLKTPLTLDADVVPCFAMNRYDAPRLAQRGHWIYPKTGSKVANYPQQNLDNGNTKNAATGHRYKEIVRCMKRLIGEMYDEGDIAVDYPGYLIESLVFNFPDSNLGHARRYDDMQSVLAFLWSGLKEQDVYETWTEPSKLIMLFRGWPNRSPQNALTLVNKARDKLGVAS